MTSATTDTVTGDILCCDPTQFPEVPVQETLAALSAAGVQGVEWSVTAPETLAALPTLPPPLRYAVLRVALRDLRDDDDVALVRQTLIQAAAMGVPLVTGPAGDPVDAPQRRLRFERLARIADEAAAQGVVYCLETGPGLCVSHRVMLDTLFELDRPEIGLSFDTGQILTYNEAINGEVALAKVCHLVRHVRLTEVSGEFGDAQRLPPGSGAVDMVRVRELMRVCGFRGPYCLALPAGLSGGAEFREQLRGGIEYLTLCGYRIG